MTNLFSYVRHPRRLGRRILTAERGDELGRRVKEMIGHTIAHYRVTAELSEGGMGEVWKAETGGSIYILFRTPHVTVPAV